MKNILSYQQIRVLEILNDGGRIFIFDDGTCGLDDVDNNSLFFRRATFNVLERMEYIELKERPALGVEIYGISEKGKVIL